MADRSIRLFVRTKLKYRPEHFQSPLWYMDVTDFAGCTVGQIKEACRSKKDNNKKIDDLFYMNQSLADDRSVAHYNFPNGAILETTSNPIMVAMVYTKMMEIERQRDAHPQDPAVQRWTHKSYIKKTTLLSVLFNAKKLDRVQPPHFPAYNDFVLYLERLGRKSANIHPQYSGRDFTRWFAEYLELDADQPDPVRSFQGRHAARLGLTGLTMAGGEVVQAGLNKGKNPKGKGKQLVKHATGTTAKPRQPKQDRLCEDCEQNFAEIYCGSCLGLEGSPGVLLCLECTHHIHRGTLRGNHDCKDISEAPRPPRSTQSYCPHPYKAPFAIVLAMTRALNEDRQRLSMDEEEIKQRAQTLTDTDLQDKQAGKIMGGFDCIENTLIPKQLVQKEASSRHTYALTQAGRELGQKLDIFDQVLQGFLLDSGLPRLPDLFSAGIRRLILVVDERERDLPRLHTLARTAGVKVIVRKLPVADYVWVLSPEGSGDVESYDGSLQAQEIMLPAMVERKSWNDLHDSMRCDRWNAQVRRMKACGFPLRFLLVEGCVDDLRHVGQDAKDRLQGELERLSIQDGFHVGRTSCWSKSSAWLFWLTHLLASAFAQGHFAGKTLQFSDLQSRVTQGLREMRFGREMSPPDPLGPCLVWESDQLVTAIFRESLGEKKMADTCGDVFQAGSLRQLLVLRDMDAYHKKRHTLLYNCLKQVSALETCTRMPVTGVIEGELTGSLKSLVHRDVFSYWQLCIQVHHQVYVMRSETVEDAQRLIDSFSHSESQRSQKGGDVVSSVVPPPSTRLASQTPNTKVKQKKMAWVSPLSSTVGTQLVPSTSTAMNRAAFSQVERRETTLMEEDFAADAQAEERMLQEALSLSLISSLEAEHGAPTVSATSSGQALCVSPLHPSLASPSLPPSLHLSPSLPSSQQHPAPRSMTPAFQHPSPSLLVSRDAQQNLDIISSTPSLGPEDEAGFSPSASSPSSSPAAGQPASGEAVGDKRLSCTAGSDGGRFSPLGFSVADPIMIDSQSRDEYDEPSAGENCLDGDEALARRLQEEETRRLCSRPQEGGSCNSQVDIASPAHKLSWDREQEFNKSLTPSRNMASSSPANSLFSSHSRCESLCSQESQSILTPPKTKQRQHHTLTTPETKQQQHHTLTTPETKQQQHHTLTTPETFSQVSSLAGYSAICPERKQGTEKDSVGPSPRKKFRGQVRTDEELARRLQSELNGAVGVRKSDDSLPASQHSSGVTPHLHQKQTSADGDVTIHSSLSVLDDETLARKLQEEELKNQRSDIEQASTTAALAEFQIDSGKRLLPDDCVSNDCFVQDDEVVAKQFQQEEELRSKQLVTNRALSPQSSSSGFHYCAEEDESLARKLQEEEEPPPRKKLSRVNRADTAALAEFQPVSVKAETRVKDPGKIGCDKLSAVLPRRQISYIDEDEMLARQLQQEEELEEGGLCFVSSAPKTSPQSKLATGGSAKLNVQEKSACDGSVSIAQMFKQDDVKESQVTQHLQADEELARKLQMEESLGISSDVAKGEQRVALPSGSGSQKTNTSLDWAVTETIRISDSKKVLDEDRNKADILSQLEQYRKCHAERYLTDVRGQTNGKTPLSAFSPTRHEIDAFPTARSTPVPGRATLASHQPKPSRQTGDCLGGLSEASSAVPRGIEVCSQRAVPTPSRDRKAPYSSFTPSSVKNIPSTATCDDSLNSIVSASDSKENVAGCSDVGNPSSLLKKKKESSSAVLPVLTNRSGGPNFHDSIDLTDDNDTSFIDSCCRDDSFCTIIDGTDSSFAGQDKFSACKKDISVLFPTYEVGKGGALGQEGRRNKLEGGGDGVECVDDEDNGVKSWRERDVKPTHPGPGGLTMHDEMQCGATTMSVNEATVIQPPSNVKCGSCGQKGHNRRFERCPNYYTEKEKLRRDAVEEAQRRRVEERAREAEERQREEQRALERLTMTRNQLQQNKEQMMQQIAMATQECATHFQSQLDDIDRFVSSKERKIKNYRPQQK